MYVYHEGWSDKETADGDDRARRLALGQPCHNGVYHFLSIVVILPQGLPQHPPGWVRLLVCWLCGVMSAGREGDGVDPCILQEQRSLGDSTADTDSLLSLVSEVRRVVADHGSVALVRLVQAGLLQLVALAAFALLVLGMPCC